MKRWNVIVVILAIFLAPVSLRAQISKPIYISLPGPGNVQHLAYVVAKEKKFYDEMGLTNVDIVVLLTEKPNFKPEQFIDDRFYKSGLKALANEPGAKLEI